ncbi:hypothetical protein [Fodinicola feengrottensis]|uniref:hypothetical protein n=1 Tax=Fodinicola feengrottensis TaxID=435914 RepID=UPI0013D74A88|nr:hypothetical protein [Fodinicola feengrottensis]
MASSPVTTGSEGNAVLAVRVIFPARQRAAARTISSSPLSRSATIAITPVGAGPNRARSNCSAR